MPAVDEPADDAAHERLAVDGHGGLGADVGQRLEARAEAGGQHAARAAPDGQLPASDASNTMSWPVRPNASRCWRNRPRYESRM